MKSRAKFPWFGWLSVSLLIIFWIINWFASGLRTHWAFFPLWLGYILMMDGFTYQRSGRSFIISSRQTFLLMFAASIPIWWLFEWLNESAQYWSYHPIGSFSDLEYYLYCSLSFSTVLPAVITTTRYLLTYTSYTLDNGPQARESKKMKSFWLLFFSALGIAMFFMLLLWPEYGMAFMWMSLFFIFDPLNHYLGKPSLFKQVLNNQWTGTICLAIAGLFCGFLWEMWNYWSLPRWEYHLPYFDTVNVFEMPLAGYLGYIPFSFELYAMYHLFFTRRNG